MICSAVRRRWVVAAAGAVVVVLGGCSKAAHEGPAVVTEVHVVTATSSSVATVAPETTTATGTQTETAPTGPTLGAPCIGADAGKTAVDPNGVAIICDEYRWRQNVGQEPGHSWADDQRAWVECIETHTMDECREILNP